MSEALASQVATLCSETDEVSYEATGLHACHLVDADKILDLAQCYLDAGYVLEMFTCLDERETQERMRLCYTFNNLEKVDRHLVHLDLAGDMETEAFEAPTLSAIVGAANWMEREVFEMYGVTFANHPELERLLLPEDADFFPLRKDFGRIEDAEGGDA